VLLFPSLAILYFTGFSEVVQVEKNSVVFIMILGIVGTGIANIVFFKLIQMSSPVLQLQ
jgi:drug/metabolite transporter (DMT)-like permease